MHEEAVRDFTRDARHRPTDAGEEHARRTVRARPRVEERGHQRVPVELARKASGASSLKHRQMARRASTNSRMRATGFDHVALKRFSMCGLICEPSPRMKRPRREHLQVVPDVGELHRTAREGDGNRRRHLEPGRVLGGQHQRKERIVRPFEREGAVVADPFNGASLGRDFGQVGCQERRVDLHRRCKSQPGRPGQHGAPNGPGPRQSRRRRVSTGHEPEAEASGYPHEALRAVSGAGFVWVARDFSPG